MIVDTARRLFREQGYPGTTLEMVATELGVTRAALYHWVANKETLLCEIHDEALDRLLERFSMIQETELAPGDKLAEALKNHLITVADNLDAIAVFFQDEASLPEGPARRIAQRKRDYDHALEALVLAAQADGSVRGDAVWDVQFALPLVRPKRSHPAPGTRRSGVGDGVRRSPSALTGRPPAASLLTYSRAS